MSPLRFSGQTNERGSYLGSSLVLIRSLDLDMFQPTARTKWRASTASNRVPIFSEGRKKNLLLSLISIGEPARGKGAKGGTETA